MLFLLTYPVFSSPKVAQTGVDSYFSAMKQHTLKIESRDQSGRGAARRLRSSGRIPACVYAKGESRQITVVAADFRDLNRELDGGAALIELNDEKGEKTLTLVQGIQRHAIKDSVDHIDFFEVARGEAFTTQVPIHLLHEQEAKGVKEEGGMIDHKTHEVDIRCRPSKLPDSVEIDVSGLSVGDAVHVSELPAIEGVEYLNDPIQVIVSCQPPTVEPEPETGTEATDADEVPAAKVKSDAEIEAEGESKAADS